MELLTAELRASFPPLYTQENNKDPVVHCKFRPGQTGPGLSPKANRKRMTSASSVTSAATKTSGAILCSPNWRAREDREA